MSGRSGVAGCFLLLCLTLFLVPSLSSSLTTSPQLTAEPRSSSFILYGASFLLWKIIRHQWQGYIDEGRNNNQTRDAYSPLQIFNASPNQKSNSFELILPEEQRDGLCPFPASPNQPPIDRSVLLAVPQKTHQLSSGEMVDLVHSDEHLSDSLLLLLDIDSYGFWVIVIIKTDEAGRPVGQIRIQTQRHYTNDDYEAFLTWLSAHKITFIFSEAKSFLYTLSFNTQNTLIGSECDSEKEQREKKLFILKPSLSPIPDAGGGDNNPDTGTRFHIDQYGLPSVPEFTSRQNRSTQAGSGASEPSASLFHHTALPGEPSNDEPPPSDYIVETTRNRLSSLAEAVGEKYFVGFITDQINDKQRFKKVFSLLPSLFVNALHDQFGLLLNIPRSLLVQLLRLISVVSNEEQPTTQARSSIEFFFHTLWQVFDPDIFIPNERPRFLGFYLNWTERMLQSHRTEIFEDLMALYKTAWQRDLDGDSETLWLGNHPALRPEIISMVAIRNQFRYAFYTEPESSEPKTKNREKVRDPFTPAWRKYKYQEGSESQIITLERYDPSDRAIQLERLENLESGYYIAERDILHISRFSSHQTYSLYVGPQLTFSFDTAEQLYRFWMRNYPLFILIRALKYSPSYLGSSCLITEEDLTSEESEALELFGFSINDLDTLDKAKLDKRFRKLSLKYHPDHPQGDEESFKKFSKARDHIEKLINREGRKRSGSSASDCTIL